MNASLSATHQKLLADSAISPEVAGALIGDKPRYQTITSARDLRALGFSQHQSVCVPGLLIRYMDAQGETFYQYRPDRKQKDRPKYETLPKVDGQTPPYGLDVPLAARERVIDSAEELWVTEGARKADALVSAGLCAVSLPGVWMFLRGGRPLPDFDTIPLSGRSVVICYDSDAVTKESVHGAMKRLTNLLRRRGALVRFCYLPDDEEQKVGADDYLAAGHTLEELRACISDTLKPVATAPVKALITALNRRCEGIATFHPKRLEFAGDGGNEGALKTLRALSSERAEIDNEFRFWAGDAYNRLDLPYGQKTATLTEAIGPGWTQQIKRWAVVCSAFRGERDYFRHAADFWFLQEIAGLTDEGQDELLTEHLNSPFTQKGVRERIKEITGNSAQQETRRHGVKSAGGMEIGKALTIVLSKMQGEDRQRLVALEQRHGSQAVHSVMARMLPEALHYLVDQVEKWAESEDLDSYYDSEGSFSAPYSSLEHKSADEETPAPVTSKTASPAVLDPLTHPSSGAPESEEENSVDGTFCLPSSISSEPAVSTISATEEENPVADFALVLAPVQTPPAPPPDLRRLRAEVRALWSTSEGYLPMEAALLARVVCRSFGNLRLAVESGNEETLLRLLCYAQCGEILPPGLDVREFVATR